MSYLYDARLLLRDRFLKTIMGAEPLINSSEKCKKAVKADFYETTLTAFKMQ